MSSSFQVVYLDALESWTTVLDLLKHGEKWISPSVRSSVRLDVQRTRGHLAQRTELGNGVEAVVRDLQGVLQKIEDITLGDAPCEEVLSKIGSEP
jgi:hypothetical protein